MRVFFIGDEDSQRDALIRNDRDGLVKIDGIDQAESNFGTEVWQRFSASVTATDAATGSYDLAWSITNLETDAVVSNTQAILINTAIFTDGKTRGLSITLFRQSPTANAYIAYVDNFVVSVPGGVVANPPAIVTPPASLEVAEGAEASFSVVATADNALTYQWSKDGVAIDGATGATYTIDVTDAADAGSYVVRVTDSVNSKFVDSAAATLSFSAASFPASLENFSLRSEVADGEQVLILGFVLDTPGTRAVLIRGIGPGLDELVDEPVLADPVLTLYSGKVPQSSNDDWSGNDGNSLGAFALTAGSKDSVLSTSLGTGIYTAVVASGDSRTGQGLVELYNQTPGTSLPLLNLSARTELPSSATLIAGLVISGTGTKTLLVRAVGPGLLGLDVTGAHADPRLEVFTGDTSITSNNDWEEGNSVSEISAASVATGAFALDPGSKDAAVLVTLGAGNHTIHATSNDGSHGIVLIEVFVVPND